MVKKIPINLPLSEDLKKRIYKEKKTIGVGGILKWRNNFIFVANSKHSYKEWSFPTGSVEKNETPEEAIIREIKEETHLKAKINKKLCILEAINISDCKVVIHIYECEGRGVPLPGDGVKAIGTFSKIPDDLHPLCNLVIKNCHK